jgi:cytochrome bd-type quinol oxidase subunit 2
METSADDQDVTTRLAKWAGSLLASSFVLVLAIFAIAFWMANSAAWVRDNPAWALLFAILLVGYVVAFICLSRLQKGKVRNPLRTWIVSMVAASAPVAVLLYAFGGNGGALVVAMAEVASVAIHVAAIGIILSRASPPNKSLERTREG